MLCLSPGHDAATKEQEAQIDTLQPGSCSLPMLAAGPAMDGEFPPHEPPPAGGILYSPPPLQSPLCGSSVQVSPTVPWPASGQEAARALSRHVPAPGLAGRAPRRARLPPGLFARAVTGPRGDAQAWAACCLHCRTGAGASATLIFFIKLFYFQFNRLCVLNS